MVVFGGGIAGCECAIHLGMEGKEVHTGCKGLEVTKEGVLCEDQEKIL